jgi:peptidoglycan/LPS O-acetylase OafA/YrhL
MLDSLQALRALAAVSVVLYHIDFLGRGAFGVDVFFVISGFIICYVTAKEHRGFLVKRLIRIVPLYWTGTLAVFLLAMLAPSLLRTTSDSLTGLVNSLLFIPYAKDSGRVYPVLFLGWTLNYEMFFYLLYALALGFNRKLAPFIVCVALLVLVLAGQIATPSSVIGRFYTDPILLEFCYGIVVFQVWPAAQATLQRVRAPTLFAAAATLLLAMAAVLAENSSYRCVLWGLPAAMLVLFLLALQGRVAFPSAVVALGDASYSLYLFHPYALKAVEKTFGPLAEAAPGSLFAATFYVALSMMLAACAYRYFERPTINLLRGWLLSEGHAASRAMRPA